MEFKKDTAMEFERDSAGIVKVCPLTAFGMAPVAGMACLLRLEYLSAANTAGAIQLIMTPKQATLLYETMSKLVATIDMTVPSDLNKM